jgi:nanoRNase/pAp phosphatase (c-di-AMP/oligoRNAs hydrolase)
MALSIEQQIFEQITKASKVLVVLPKDLHADYIGGGLALSRFLKKLEKDSIVLSQSSVPEQLHFLPGADVIQHELVASSSFVVSVATTTTEMDQISYHQEEGRVDIFLKPKEGAFTEQDISFRSDRFPYDLIITLGARSLEDLGEVFEHNADVFFETPKINIDNHPDNTSFGAINFVDIAVTSVSELLSNLFEKFETQLIDEDIATCLLTGIIAKTHSFQHAHTTPRAFLKASELIGFGGRQQEIIKYLFKTKPLPLLRLWGRALARIKMADDVSAVYSLINLSDFGKAGAGNSDAEAVLWEMMENISGYQVVGLITEVLNGGSRILFSTSFNISLDSVLKQFPEAKVLHQPFNGSFHILEWELPSTQLTDAETQFLDSVKSLQSPIQ